MAKNEELAALPCAAAQGAVFLLFCRLLSSESRSLRKHFGSHKPQCTELQLGLHLEQDLADWRQGAQLTQLHEGEPTPLLWR